MGNHHRGLAVLVLTGPETAEDSRWAQTASLLPTGSTTTVVANTGGNLPELGGYDCVVAGGELLGGPGSFEALQPFVERGGSLVVQLRAGTGPLPESLTALTGLSGVAAPLPVGEWFATVASHGHTAVERAEHEFPVRATFIPLDPGSAAQTLLTVSVGLKPFAALTEHRIGAGRVVTCGLAATGTGDLGRILGRAARAVTDDSTAHAPTGIAIVGYGPHGGMGYAHALAVQATAGLELVAVCDPDPDRRKEAERQTPGVRTYADLSDVLADPDVALAVVATPPVSHATLGLQLLRHGRHVAVEKPLCFTLAESADLSRAAEENGVALTVHQNRRWDVDFLAVRSAVESGALGEVFNVETFVGGFEHPCREWHSEVTISGGAAYDWGSHYLDWTLLLMGSSPARVSATGHKRVWRDITNFDQERIHLWWHDGREAEFVHSDVAAVRRPKFYVQGTTGTLVGHYRPVAFDRITPGLGYVVEEAHHAEAPADLRIVTYSGSNSLTEASLPLAPARRFPFHRNLADHLRDGIPLAVPVDSVRPVIAILETAVASTAQGGATLDVPAG